MIRSLWRTLLFLWTASVLLVISLPWSNFDGAPHWENIQWIPFAYLSFNHTVLVEIAANILAFIPVGYLMVRSLSPRMRHPLLLAAILGFLSSANIEFYQLFCHDRVPSTTDVINNVAGTIFGAWTALRIDHALDFCALRFRRLSS